MAVTHGGDTDRMREIARQIQGSGDDISGCLQQSQTSRAVLVENWSGPDAEYLLASVQSAEADLSTAAERLIAFAQRLMAEADEQDGASQGGRRSSGPPPDALADNNDARDNHWWELRKKNAEDYETDGDPGQDIEMPKGLDRDSQLARDLMATPQGRETLEWLRKNDITVNVDEGKDGAYYTAHNNTITLGKGHDDPATLIHEANHAQWDARDQDIDIRDSTREEYIKHQLDEEIEGQSKRWAWNEEARAAGIDVPEGSDERAYRQAVQEARDAGATPAEAETAGREEVRKMFMGDHPTVNYTQSTDGRNYAERHGDDWDDANDWWPLW